MAPLADYPVHESRTVLEAVDIYRTDEWWKAAIRYTINDNDPEVAIYLWHRDDGEWTQKNKYTIKSTEAWLMDRELVEAYLPERSAKAGRPDSFPVSDYYHVAAGETVVKTDEWWKAIVVVDRKGTYDTHEVIIYLWQLTDGGWSRRQKYAIKRPSDWADDRLAVEELLDLDVEEPSLEGESSRMVSGESPIVAMAKELGIHVEGDSMTALTEKLEATHLSRTSGD